MKPLLMLPLALAAAIMPTAAQPPAPPAESSPAVSTLPIVGLAAVSFRVSDLARSRRFYRDVLGFPEAFDLRDRTGRVTAAWFKVRLL